VVPQPLAGSDATSKGPGGDQPGSGRPSHVFAALSEFERDVLRERTRAGLAAARTRGARLGRPRALTPEQLEMARTLMANPNLSARQVARQLGVHRATLYRNLGGR
jgi:DNA invertase Pin-like site-specific DNA recombinase